LVSVLRNVAYLSGDLPTPIQAGSCAQSSNVLRCIRLTMDEYRENFRVSSAVARMLCKHTTGLSPRSTCHFNKIVPLFAFDAEAFSANLVHGVMKSSGVPGQWILRKHSRGNNLLFASNFKTTETATAYMIAVIRLCYELQVLTELLLCARKVFSSYSYPCSFNSYRTTVQHQLLTIEEEVNMAVLHDNELQERLQHLRQRDLLGDVTKSIGLDMSFGVQVPTANDLHTSAAWVQALQAELTRRNELLNVMEKEDTHRIQAIVTDCIRLLLDPACAVHLEKPQVFDMLTPSPAHPQFANNAIMTCQALLSLLYNHERMYAREARVDVKCHKFLHESVAISDGFEAVSTCTFDANTALLTLNTVANQRLVPPNCAEIARHCMCAVHKGSCHAARHENVVASVNNRTRKVSITHRVHVLCTDADRAQTYSYCDDFYLDYDGLQIVAVKLNCRTIKEQCSAAKIIDHRVITPVPRALVQEIRPKMKLKATDKAYKLVLERHGLDVFKLVLQ